MAGAAAKGLREWAKQCTAGYEGVSVTNLTTSWRDGMAFCAIIHHFRPDLIDFASLSKENIRENNKLAFEVAEQELGIPALLDPADMVALKVPDKLSIMTYLSQLYNFFSGPGLGAVGKAAVKRPPASLSPAPGIKKSKALDDDNPFKTGGAHNKRQGSPNFSKSHLSSLKTSLQEDIEQFMPAEVVQRSDNNCAVCQKYVHIVEKVFVDGKLYHRNCFRCAICKVSLKAGAYKDGDSPGELICTRHNQTTAYQKPEPKKPPETKPEEAMKVEEPPLPTVAAKARAKFFEEQAQQNAESEANNTDPFAKRSAQKAKQEAEDKENKNMLPGILKNIAEAKKRNQAKPVVEEEPPAKPPRSPYGLKNENGNNNSPPMAKKDLHQEDVVMEEVELTPPPRKRKSDKVKKTKDIPTPSPLKVDLVPPKEDVVPMKTDVERTKDDVKETQKPEKLKPKDDVKETQKPEKLKPKEIDTKPPRDVSPKPQERKPPKPRPRKANGDNLADVEVPKPKPRPRSAELLAEPVAKPESYPDEKNPFDEPSPTEVEQVQSQLPEKPTVVEEPKKPSPVETRLKEPKEEKTRLPEPKQQEEKSNQPNQAETIVDKPKKENHALPQPKPEQTGVNQTQPEQTGVNQNQPEQTDVKPSKETVVPPPKAEPAQVAPAAETPPTESNRPERANPFDTKPAERPNPFDTKPTERKLTRLSCSLNPFDEPSDEEDEDSKSDSLNPFDISDDDLSDVDLDDHDEVKTTAVPTSEEPASPRRRSAFPDVKRKQKRRAPPPPTGSKPGLPPVMAVRPQPTLRGEKDADSSTAEKGASPQKAQKKRRAPAPPVYRRQINSKNRVPQEEIDKELGELEKQLTELEHRGVKLEIMLRHGMASTIAGEDEDELLSDWFNLVNEKNKLVRRETELVYITRQQSLEDQQANVEYELRCLMQIPEERKTVGEKSREARLLNELLEIVAERNSIVDSLDEDRIREEEEDRDIEAMMAEKGALSAHPRQEDQMPPKEKKGRGLFGKKDKKDKEKDKLKRKPKVQI